MAHQLKQIYLCLAHTQQSPTRAQPCRDVDDHTELGSGSARCGYGVCTAPTPALRSHSELCPPSAPSALTATPARGRPTHRMSGQGRGCRDRFVADWPDVIRDLLHLACTNTLAPARLDAPTSSFFSPHLLPVPYITHPLHTSHDLSQFLRLRTSRVGSPSRSRFA